MAQYIDKDALVAEIKRLLDKYISVYTFNYGATKDLNHLISFIDTLEVKDPWKPTDEQLEALEWSLSDYRNVIFEERHDILTSLYNDLKKL